MRGKRFSYEEPWDLLGQWQKDLERWFSNQDRSFSTEDSSTVATSSWTPAMDIAENEEAFLIYLDIPGVDPAQVEITMENGILSIRGERLLGDAEEHKNLKRTERVHGVFHRRFSLPDSADPEKISAAGKHGVLEISIPKRPVAQARKIKIDVK